jgi:putative acetyltransferase
VKIRRARAEDVPAIARIAADSYRHAFKSILDERALQARGAVFFGRRLRRVRGRLRVAVARGRVLGFALTTRGHLDMLFVAPRVIGRGTGLRLLRDVERRGVRTLECFRDNLAARRFYERAGWRLVRGYERAFIGKRHAFVFYERAP